MSKQFLLHDEARAAILRGMNTAADIVGSTLGPLGGTVVLGRPAGYGPAKVTKDGVSTAAELELPDPWENEGAKLIIEVAKRTNQEAGDGTTAATILTRAIFREGCRQITAGCNPHAIKRGIQQAVVCVTDELKRIAQPIPRIGDIPDLDTLIHIATIAANGDAEIGTVIGEAVQKAGLEGTYSPDTSPDGKTTYTITEGLQFQRGFIDQTFMRDRAAGQTVFHDCNVFVTDRRLVDGPQMVTFLQNYQAKAAHVPLLIIAGDVESAALSTLAVNNLNNIVQACAVRTPGTGEARKDEIEDIAILTGARYFQTSNLDLPETATIQDFGSARKVIVTPHHTTIVGGEGAALSIETRKDELRGRLADPKLTDFDRAVCERRLAAISASIVVFHIASKTDSNYREISDRFEDSLRATLAALKEGIVPGGGTALLRTLPALQSLIDTLQGDEKTGAQIIAQSLSAPLRQIATNAGKSGDVIVEKLFTDLNTNGWGWNAAADRFEDMPAAGIIDPAMVVRLALQNSAEQSALLLTAKAMIIDLPEANPQPKQKG